MAHYVLLRTPEEVRPYLERLCAAKVLAVDTETTGLEPHRDRLRLVQIAAPSLPVLIFDCFSFLPAGAGLLREILCGSAVKVFHNAKFDLQFLMPISRQIRPVFDTMLAAQLLRSSGGPARVSLKAVAAHYLAEDVDKGEQRSDWSGVLSESQLAYAAEDAALLLRLREAMVPLLYKNRLGRVAQIEFSCVRALAYMEYCGIFLDLPRWQALTASYEDLQAQALNALRRFSGQPMSQLSLWGEEVSLNQNFESNAFVLALLRSHGIAVRSTSRRSLAPYQEHPLVQALSEYRRCAKALSTFLHPLPDMLHMETGRLHPHYGQIGAWSGRMSCGGPNVQQIPREAAFRRCFAAPPGRVMVLADYSQIELRVAAQISGDERMLQAYAAGEDLHRLTASLISGMPPEQVSKTQRQAAKAVNFGLIFGMGAQGLKDYAAQSYGVSMTLADAERFRASFFKAYPGIAHWHQRVREGRPQSGQVAEGRTLTGRKFLFTENAGLAGLYNTPVQGTAADIAKAALGLLMDGLGEWPDMPRSGAPRSGTPCGQTSASEVLADGVLTGGSSAGDAFDSDALTNGTPASGAFSSNASMHTNASQDVCLVATVHDEILMEAPQAQGADVALLLRQAMEDAGAQILPDVRCVAESQVSLSWAEK